MSNITPGLKFGFARENITPKRNIGLQGYFEPRPNRGVHDQLNVRAAVFECNGIVVGIVSSDLCVMKYSLVKRIIRELEANGITFAENIVFSVTHTHTGPYTANEGAVTPDGEYINSLIAKTVSAVKNAYANLAEAELFAGRSECTTLAFNRRFWMKDGTVLTNPGKLNPDIVKPEGGIDAEIPFLVVRQEGEDRLIIANISNHTDTIGDDLVSADWVGRMEREIQNRYEYDIPVITLIAPQGNINHFNVNNNVNQTCYAEACRIGRGYAAAILSMLYAVRKIEVDALSVVSQEFEAPFYRVTDAEYAEAKKIVEEIGEISACSADDLTSEGLAAGNLFVKKLFANRVIENRENPVEGKRIEKMLALKFGDDFAIVTIPGEAFFEIGKAIKDASPYPFTMVSALSMGYIGYIGLPESYERGGGYETRPNRTSPAHDLSSTLIETGIGLLKQKGAK